MANSFCVPQQDPHPSRGVLVPANPPPSLEALATIRRCERGQAIYGQEESAEAWYRVVAGLLRRFSVRPSGRRQIVDFLQPGDFFGFAGGDENHGFCVEAVVAGTVVACYPRGRVEALADADPRVGRFIRRKALEAVNRLQGQIRILGRTRAPEKVGAFLLDMATRFAGRDGARLVLPMSRYDIADYLSLSVETVSRAMTELQESGAIMLAGTRQVTIVLRDTLEEEGCNEWSVLTRAEAPNFRSPSPDVAGGRPVRPSLGLPGW